MPMESPCLIMLKARPYPVQPGQNRSGPPQRRGINNATTDVERHRALLWRSCLRHKDKSRQVRVLNEPCITLGMLSNGPPGQRAEITLHYAKPSHLRQELHQPHQRHQRPAASAVPASASKSTTRNRVFAKRGHLTSGLSPLSPMQDWSPLAHA